MTNRQNKDTFPVPHCIRELTGATGARLYFLAEEIRKLGGSLIIKNGVTEVHAPVDQAAAISAILEREGF